MSRNKHNVAARMGRWSAGHWKTAVFGWLALVVAAFAVGGAVGTKNVDPNTAGPGESGRMDRILDAGFEQPARERPGAEEGLAGALPQQHLQLAGAHLEHDGQRLVAGTLLSGRLAHEVIDCES